MRMLLWKLILITGMVTYTKAVPDLIIYSKPYEYTFVTNRTKSWLEAREDCTSRNGGLVKIGSETDLQFIVNHMPRVGEMQLWTGANDRYTEGYWQWMTDDTPAFYANWVPGQPDNWDLEEHCGTIFNYGEWLGQWNDAVCRDSRGYICQKNIFFLDEYQYVFSYHRVNWTQAKANCEKDGMHMIKADSPAVTTVIKDYWTAPAWIGATDVGREGEWKWLDGTDAWKNSDGVRGQWNGTDPNGGVGENCAAVIANGKWIDYRCYPKLRFICQKSLPASVSHNGRVFTFHRAEKVNWGAAKAGCKSKGSRLAEIYDEATNDMIRNNIIDPDTEFYIGGSESSGLVTWGSGKFATYTTGWAHGEPNNPQHTKIALTSIGWKDVSSTRSLPYICEMVNTTNIMLRPFKKLGNTDDRKLTCTADGVPLADVFWKFASKIVSFNNSDSVYQEREQGRSVLHVAEATLMDEGTYFCVAENRAGNFAKGLQKNYTLSVKSPPNYVKVNALNCSSTIIVKWEANLRARNVRHKIFIMNAENSSESYTFFESPEKICDETSRFQMKGWAIYNVTITPCPKDICKNSYAVSSRTLRRTVGFPEKVRDPQVRLSNKYSCSINWTKPSEDPMKYITEYKVTIVERRNYVPSGSTVRERTRDILLNGDQTSYFISGKPNFRYKVGIQAKNCAGFGEISWLTTNCVTEATENPEKPAVRGKINSDGSLNVTIKIRNVNHGAMTCAFVIVKAGNNVSEYYDYARDDLIRANSSAEEYIAFALDMRKWISGTEFKVILGDERISTCDLSLTSASTKEPAINHVFVGRNFKLNQNSDQSIFIVTSTTYNGNILLTASESVLVTPDQRSVSSGLIGKIDWWVTCVIAGSLALIMMISICVLVKRKPKAGNSPDAIYHNVDPTTTTTTTTTSFHSGVQHDNKPQVYEVIGKRIELEKNPKAACATSVETDYIVPNEYPLIGKTCGYDDVTSDGTPEDAPFVHTRENVETTNAPNVLPQERHEVLYTSPARDRPEHMYFKISRSNYESVDN